MPSAISIHGSSRWWDFVRPFLDASAVVASLAVVTWASGRDVQEATLILAFIAVVLFLLGAQLTGLYRRHDSGSADVEMSGVAATWTLAVLGLAVLAFATRTGSDHPRSVMFAWVMLTPAVVGLTRMCLRIVQGALLRKGIGVRRVAIAGLNDLGRTTAENIALDVTLGMEFVGYFDDRSAPRAAVQPSRTGVVSADGTRNEGISDLPVSPRGKLSDLVDSARRGEIDIVLVTLPMRAEARIRSLLDELSDTTASVYIVPDFFVFELLHSRWTDLGGLPAVSVFESPLFGVDGVAKRASDLALSLAALLVASLPMLAIAAAVKLSSPGPVFFRQRRYGLDGREIRVWKFRSMRTCDDGSVVRQATKGDPRVTRVGAILRKTSLDELPQLFNVLEGTMSLVGPRPHASAHNEQYRRLIRGYMLRHKVKPGITGLAQVNGCRGETETVEKMKRRIEWDHAYIRGWSLWLDLKILVKTLFIVWKQPEAY